MTECVNFCAYGLLILASLFYATALFALAQLIRLVRGDNRGNTVQKQLHFCIFFAKSVRATVLVYRSLRPAVTPSADYIWSIFPTLCYFATISLLLFYWARVYHRAHNADNQSLFVRLHRVWIVFNLTLVVLAVVIFILLEVLDADLVTERQAEGVFVATISLLAALGFFLYGRRLYKRLKGIRYASDVKSKRIKQVSTVATVSFVAYILRAPAVLVLSFVLVTWDLRAVIFTFAYLFVVEGIPSWLILYTMRKLPPSASRRGGPSCDISYAAPQLGGYYEQRDSYDQRDSNPPLRESFSVA